MRPPRQHAAARRATALLIGLTLSALALTGCVPSQPDTAPTTSSTPTATPTRTATPRPTATPTPTPTPTESAPAEPTPEPDVPDANKALVVSACTTLNDAYDGGRDAWLAARDQAAALTAQAAAANPQWAGADTVMRSFATIPYPDASSSADDVNAYLDAYVAVISTCAAVGVQVRTE